MINRIILLGFLGSDPEVRYSQSGAAIANFTMATTETWKKDGVKESVTEWHRIVVFKRLAEICGENLKKGSKIYLEGKIQTRKWEDKNGNKRWTTEIVAQNMKMLDSRGSTQQEEPPAPMNKTESKPESGDIDMGEDVPF